MAATSGGDYVLRPIGNPRAVAEYDRGYQGRDHRCGEHDELGLILADLIREREIGHEERDGEADAGERTDASTSRSPMSSGSRPMPRCRARSVALATPTNFPTSLAKSTPPKTRVTPPWASVPPPREIPALANANIRTATKLDYGWRRSSSRSAVGVAPRAIPIVRSTAHADETSASSSVRASSSSVRVSSSSVDTCGRVVARSPIATPASV